MVYSNRDPNQISQAEHDDVSNAKRVVVVGQDFQLDSNKIAESLEKAVLKGLSNMKLDEPKSPSYTPIEVERIVPIPQIEIRTIEVPKIIEKIEYREIEKPIIIEKIVTQILEKPVVIKEIEFREVYREKEFPKWHKICTVMQTGVVLALLLLQILSHLK